MLERYKTTLITALRWSERYTKTDMVYLFKGGGWLTLGQIAGVLSGLVVAYVLANYVNQTIVGEYKFVMSVVGILGICTLPGLLKALANAVARGKEGSWVEVTRLQLYGGLFGSVCASLTAGYYYTMNNMTLSLSLAIAAALFPFAYSFNSHGAFLGGKMRFDVTTKYYIASQIFISFLLVSVVLFTAVSTPILVGAYIALHAVTSIFFFRRTFNRYNPKEKEIDPGVKKYGFHLTAIHSLNTLVMHIDKILVFHFLGAVEVALYVYAILFPEQLKGPIKNIASMAQPKFATSDVSKNKIAILRKTFLLTMALFVPVLGYIIVAPYVFAFLFPDFTDAVAYSQVFALSLMALTSFIPLSALEAHAAKKQLYLGNFIMPGFQTVTMLLAIPLYGLWGLVITKVIFRFFNLALLSWLLYGYKK